MKSKQREPFSTSSRATAMKPLTFNGKLYKVGQEFPWKKLGCEERKARQLWESRLINCDASAPKAVTVVKTKPVKIELTPEVATATDG